MTGLADLLAEVKWCHVIADELRSWKTRLHTPTAFKLSSPIRVSLCPTKKGKLSHTHTHTKKGPHSMFFVHKSTYTRPERIPSWDGAYVSEASRQAVLAWKAQSAVAVQRAGSWGGHTWNRADGRIRGRRANRRELLGISCTGVQSGRDRAGEGERK